MSDKNEYRGKIVEEAIEKACDFMKLSREELDIQVVSAGSTGIFGLCRREAVIVALPKQAVVPGKIVVEVIEEEIAEIGQVDEKVADPEAEEPGSESEPEPAVLEVTEIKDEKPVISKVEKPEVQSFSLLKGEKEAVPFRGVQQPLVEPGSEVMDEVKICLDRLLVLMGFPSTLEMTAEAGKIHIQMSGEYEESLIGREGQVLDGLQYLLRKMIGRKFSERVVIFLDAGDFRKTRKQHLERTALQLAKEVKETGKNRTISPMNPAERRIVHMALQEDTSIRSRSIGAGIFKKVLIYQPGKGKKRAPRRRGGKKRNRKLSR